MPAAAGANLRRRFAAHLARTVNESTRAELAATSTRLLFYDAVLSASRAAWAAAVWRLDGESLVAALAEATACMCGGSASGAPAVDGSYEKAFRALAAATMVAVGLTPPPTGYHIPMRFLRLLEGKAVVVARALFRVNDRPSLDALVAAVATTRPVRLRPLLTDVDLLTVAAPRGVTGPALARLATAIKARVAAGPPEPPPCSWAMSPPRTEVLVAVTGSAAAAAQAAAWYESPLGPSRPMSEDYHDMRYDCAAAAHAAAAQLPPTGNGWTTTVTVSGRKPRAVVRVTTCDAAARRLRQAWEDAQTDARRADAFLAAVPPAGAAAAPQPSGSSRSCRPGHLVFSGGECSGICPFGLFKVWISSPLG